MAGFPGCKGLVMARRLQAYTTGRQAIQTIYIKESQVFNAYNNEVHTVHQTGAWDNATEG